MNRPDISVVMSVYNNADLLPTTLDSIFSQEGVALEAIVIDDGSTDASGALLDEAARQDPRLRVVHKKNEGLTRALIEGCAMAGGTYIARLDVGDVMTPDRLRRQKTVLDAHPDVVLATCWTEVYGPEWEPLYTVKGKASGPVVDEGWVADVMPSRMDENLLDGPTSHPSVMFRTDAYRAAGGYRGQFYYGQDWDLWYRLAERGKFAGVQAALYRCRIFPEGISMRNAQCQRRIHACSHGAFQARRRAEDESRFLAAAEALRPLPQTTGRTRSPAADSAAGCYFVGEVLRRKGDIRCRSYLRKAVSSRPFMIKSWVRLAQSVMIRSPGPKQSNKSS